MISNTNITTHSTQQGPGLTTNQTLPNNTIKPNKSPSTKLINNSNDIKFSTHPRFSFLPDTPKFEQQHFEEVSILRLPYQISRIVDDPHYPARLELIYRGETADERLERLDPQEYKRRKMGGGHGLRGEQNKNFSDHSSQQQYGFTVGGSTILGQQNGPNSNQNGNGGPNISIQSDPSNLNLTNNPNTSNQNKLLCLRLNGRDIELDVEHLKFTTEVYSETWKVGTIKHLLKPKKLCHVDAELMRPINRQNVDLYMKLLNQSGLWKVNSMKNIMERDRRSLSPRRSTSAFKGTVASINRGTSVAVNTNNNIKVQDRSNSRSPPNQQDLNQQTQQVDRESRSDNLNRGSLCSTNNKQTNDFNLRDSTTPINNNQNQNLNQTQSSQAQQGSGVPQQQPLQKTQPSATGIEGLMGLTRSTTRLSSQRQSSFLNQTQILEQQASVLSTVSSSTLNQQMSHTIGQLQGANTNESDINNDQNPNTNIVPVTAEQLQRTPKYKPLSLNSSHRSTYMNNIPAHFPKPVERLTEKDLLIDTGTQSQSQTQTLEQQSGNSYIRRIIKPDERGITNVKRVKWPPKDPNNSQSSTHFLPEQLESAWTELVMLMQGHPYKFTTPMEEIDHKTYKQIKKEKKNLIWRPKEVREKQQAKLLEKAKIMKRGGDLNLKSKGLKSKEKEDVKSESNVNSKKGGPKSKAKAGAKKRSRR